MGGALGVSDFVAEGRYAHRMAESELGWDGEYHCLISGDGFRPTGYIDPTTGENVTVESDE